MDTSTYLNESIVSKALQTVEIPIQQNLPYIQSPFLGRERDLEMLANLLVSRSAQTININGPPAFGKSTLAIKLGEKLLASKSTTMVRYIDTESTRPSWYLCTHSTAPNDPPTYNNESKGHAVQNFTGSRDPNYYHLYEPNLCEWSEKLNSWSVVILDNCDDILHGELRNEFITVIRNHLRQVRALNLSIIITSQERLFFLGETFKSWPLKELSQGSSIALLQHYVPDLSDKYAQKFSTVVGHCPLALKVVGKLLVNRDSEKFGALLDELESRVIKTISDKLTDDKTRFRTIMDVAYNKLDPHVQICSRIISFFPGSFNLRMGESIVGRFMDPDCIQSVVRKSFSDEIPLGNQVRYSMHKLIRDYFAEKHQRIFTSSFYRGKLNWHFMDYYSDFLTEMMVNTYHKNITEEEHYEFYFLEAHNILYFTQRILLLEEPVSENAALSLGFIIQQNLIQTNSSSTLYQNISWKAYHAFTSNQTIFNKLCVSCTHEVCASIYWKTVVSVSLPECTKDLTNSYFYPYWKSATSFFGTKPCSYIFSCSNLTSLKKVKSLISSEVMRRSSSEKDTMLLLSMLDFAVTRCFFTGMVSENINVLLVMAVLWIILLLPRIYRNWKSTCLSTEESWNKMIIGLITLVIFIYSGLLFLVLKNKVLNELRDTQLLFIGSQFAVAVIFILITMILQVPINYALHHRIKFYRVFCILYIGLVLVIPILFIMYGPEEPSTQLVFHILLIYGLLRILNLATCTVVSIEITCRTFVYVILAFVEESCRVTAPIIIVYLILSYLMSFVSWLADYETVMNNEIISSGNSILD